MMLDEPETLDWDKGGGLLPVVVQHALSGDILMLAYANRAALQRTLQEGQAVFFSRSRNSLWLKGETSGNTLVMQSVTADCDGDSLLYRVIPAGPACHLGTKSCFAAPVGGVLSELDAVIERRMREQPAGSYVAGLAAQDITRVAQKLGEEAVETVVAATAQGDEQLLAESADLLFHLMLVLRKRKLSFVDVLAELASRQQGV